jgi:V8-like Glu-specific endopeptidase
MNAHRTALHHLASFAIASIVSCTAATAAIAAQPGVAQQGTVTVYMVPAAPAGVDTMDYVSARPIELPVAHSYSPEMATNDLIEGLLFGVPQGEPGFSPGGFGDGKTRPVNLGNPAPYIPDSADVTPAAAGASNRPFSTARADLYKGTTSKTYPYRAAGRLFATINGGSGTCSASLIKPGLVVTAAHCVSKFGANQFYSNIRFVPGYRKGAAPFGSWNASQVRVLASYLNGTDPCSQSGVICRNDVAVITLAAQNSKYPGTSTGWYGYGWNGHGFTSSGLTHVTQLGYPSCLDSGNYMERNDAQGLKSASHADNTVIGSLMCPGSSGGPWLINFGLPSKLTGTTAGTYPDPNFVVGTTSWVSLNTNKEMGASPFLSTNIVPLVNAACAATPHAC